MNIRSFTHYANILFVVCAVLFVTSCGEDDTPIIDPVDDGVLLGDGFYLTQDGKDLTLEADAAEAVALSAMIVEDAGYGCQDRTGFIGGYAYLNAANYTIVEVVSKEVMQTVGGTAGTKEDGEVDCDGTVITYTLVETDDSGTAFAVPAAGLYQVTHDLDRGEIILYHIKKVELTGGALDANLILAENKLDADGGSWTGTDVTITDSWWKLRFNCDWAIDRRDDPAAGHDFTNGYVAFTNLGGLVEDLGSDCSNLAAEPAIYTVDVTWDPTDSWRMNLTKTGEVAQVVFPDDYSWGIIGSATPIPDWSADTDLVYEGESNGVHTWYIQMGLVAGACKLRLNDDWGTQIGHNLDMISGDLGNISGDGNGGDIVIAADATYDIRVKTDNGGESWTAEFIEL